MIDVLKDLLPGDKIKCIDDAGYTRGPLFTLVRGRIYTFKKYREDRAGCPDLYVMEMSASWRRNRFEFISRNGTNEIKNDIDYLQLAKDVSGKV